MRNLLVWSLIFFAAMATLVLNASGQVKRVKRCYYVNVGVHKTVPKGCNACARLKKVEEELNALLNKPEPQRTAFDYSRIERLEKEFDDLLPRVIDLEKRMGAAENDISDLRSDLNTTNVKVDGLDTRLTVVERRCEMVPGKDNRPYWDCNGKLTKVKTGPGVVDQTITWVDRGLQWFCILSGKCVIGGGNNTGRNDGITNGNWSSTSNTFSRAALTASRIYGSY